MNRSISKRKLKRITGKISMKKTKTKTGKASSRGVSKKKKSKRTRRANTKDIIKADKLAERLRRQADHDIEQIRKTLVVDDYADLDDDNDGYHDEEDPFKPYEDEMYE